MTTPANRTPDSSYTANASELFEYASITTGPQRPMEKELLRAEASPSVPHSGS
jgi:hypothetical protein